MATTTRPGMTKVSDKATQPALVTQPAKVSVRSVVRRVAFCPFPKVVTRGEVDTVADEHEGSWGDCEFNDRKSPTLHTSAESANVEAGRHIREIHGFALHRDVKGKVKRQIVNETIELDGAE